MKTFRTLFPLLLFASVSVAQAQWTWLSPLPEGNEWFDAAFPTPQRGWVAGGNGAVMTTTDGGMTWTSQRTPLRTTPFIGLNILFADDRKGLITANNGTIMRTADGGLLWEIAPPPGFIVQRAKLSPNGTVWGFGGSGVIAKSTDMGLTWTRLATGINTVVFDLAFPEPARVVAVCGGGIILSSTDDGATWSRQTLAVTSDIVSVEFLDAARGFALQESKFLLSTTDGGATWRDTTIFVNKLRQIRFADDANGWMLSNSAGTVHRTVDGGATWSQIIIDSTLRYSFQNVIAHDIQHVTIIGEGGGIFVTTDGGATWMQRGTGVTRAHMAAVTGLSDSSAWCFGVRTAVFTTDGGKTWAPNRAPATPVLRTGHALSPQRLIGGGAQGEMMLSTDGGVTWTTTATLPPKGQIEQIVFVDDQNGWLAGNHGTVARTTDAGATWQFTDPGVTEDFHGVHALSPMNAWIVGTNGTIFSTTDGGGSWVPQMSGTMSTLQTVFFTSPTDGWAGGQLVLLRTTDGGSSWRPATMPGLDVIYRIFFTSDQQGYFVLSRSVARTKDGGATLYRTDYPSTGLRDLSAMTSGHLWLVGDFGAVLHYTPGPAVLLRPGLLDFGDVSTNRHRDLPFTVENVGERDMNFSNAAALGVGFTIVTAAPQTIAPGASASVVVRFAPPDTLPYRGIAAVQSNAQVGTPTIDLAGRGIPPGIPAFDHSPAAVDFGKVRLGTFSGVEVQLHNRSALNILVSEERISGGDSLMFQVARPSTYFWFPGTRDSVRTLFAPQRPGVFNSRLLIASNDPVEPEYFISLRGEAINPQVSPSDSTIRFGYVWVDSARTYTLVLTNSGTADLVTLNYAIQGIHAGDFQVTPPPTTPTAPNGTINVPVRFAPKDVGPRTALLYFESNDVMNPSTQIPIIGNGTNTDVEAASQPGTVSLTPGYPNPVSSGNISTFTVDLPVASTMSLAVYDVLGRRVATIIDAAYAPGTYLIPWQTTGLVPGAYSIELRSTSAAGMQVRHVRMLVVR